MALNVKSLYSNNSSGTNSTAKKGGLNVHSLRDREFELKVNENKSIGNISYGAKQAIESDTLDSYTPKNDAEKSVLDTYKKWTGYGRTYETVKAQYDKNKFGKGNIDLTNRPIFKNSNGTISTVDSIGITEDGKEVVIPTIITDKNGNAKRLTDDEAIKHYHETGEYLGKFNTRDEADEYAQTLHIDQELYYAALPEITTEEEQTLSKYGFNPISFSNNDFKLWAETHNFEYRMAGNDLSGTEYKWLPKSASKWNPWKTLTTDEEKQDKKVLERFIEKKNLKANATNHPVFTSAVTVVTAPYRGLAGAVATVKDGVSAIVGKDVSTYDTAHEIVDDANIIRETVTDEHASKWFDGASGKLGNYGALTYNGIMSIGDMVMTSLTTKCIGSGLGLTGKSLAAFTSNATSALLGSNSASSTIMEKKKEGYSDGKAVLVGVSTGLAEYITEKYSLEAIFKAPASVMKQGIRSFIAEGSEEMASDVLSKIADRVIAGNDSTIKKSIENYMQNGMSKNDAIKQATQDSIYETLSAGLVGGFSGVAVSSAYHGFGRSEIKKTGADMRGVAADVITSGLDSPKNSNAYKYAEKLSKKGVDKISDYELGLQHIYNIEQIEYEQKKEEKATRKAEKATRKAQSSVSETADAREQAPTNFPYNVYAEPQISLGDTFKDTKTGNTITVVERDAENTTVEISTGEKTETREFTNNQADTLVTNEQFEQMESSEVFSPEDAQPVTSINEQNMHVSTENTTENASLTNTDVTKEDNFPEAFKLDENGKIRFNQVGINYDNQNYREGNFNVLAQGGIETKNIKGGIVGKYGVHKKDNGYFGVTLLSSGMDIAAFSTFDEALSFATYTNKEVAFNDIFYVRNAEGILTIDATSEFMKYGEQIKAIKSEKAYLQTAKDAETSETVTSINSENMPVTDQNITDNDTVTNTNVSKAEVAESGINSQKAEEIAPVSDYIVRETENSETPVAVKNTTADANTSLETKAATSKTSETPADNNKTMTKTDKKVAVEKSIAKKKKPVTKQNKTKITDFSDFPKVEDTLKEGQTLTLKHTKNLHTVFKDATRVAVGKDVITDGYIAIPRSDEAVSKIKKVVDESIIQYGDLTFEKIYEKDNDVVISGVPKITDKIINGKKEKVYVFKIGNEFYTCQQKHLDALNYGNNTFVANKDANSVWTVKDENGEVIAAIVPAFKKGSISDEIYDRLDSVADVINAKNLKKAKIAQATLSQEEMNYFGNGNALVTVNVDGVPFLCNNYLLLRTDEYTIDLMKEEYERDITLNESFAERAATMFSQDIIGDVTKTANADVYKTDYNGKVAISEKTGKPIVEKSLTACLADDTPFCFDTKMFNMLDKASDSLKIIKFTDSLETSALIGFDESGEVVGYLCPVRESANTAVEIDGKQYKYYTKGSIDEKMADTAETDDLKNEEKSAIIEKDKKAFSETDEAVSSVSEYTKDMKPMQKGKVEKALNAPYQTKEYGLLTYADFMERSIADGRQLEERRDLKAKVRNGRNDFDFVKDVEASYNRNKAKYNEIGVNDFALAKEARELRENKTGGKYIMSVDQELYYYLTGDESVLPESCFDKTYCVMLSDNQFYSVPKTAYDYGKWLVANDADVSFSLEDIKSSKEIEKGVSNDEKRNNVTARSVGRSVSESADKSGGSLYEAARESEENGGQRTDTESSRRIYAENVRAVQGTEVRQQGAFRCEFINPEYYTDDMRAIAESNAKKGIKTYFFFGDGRAAFCPDARFRGAIRKNEVYIQCDHARYSPEQINKHELVHKNYKSEDVQKVREYINNNLTEEEKRYIINVMYSHYAQQCKGDVNKVFEEFVCDVLSGINSCGGKFADITQEYWSKHTDLIDSYSAADYSDSTDAGGVSLSSQRESILYEGQPMYSLNKGTDKIRYSPQGLRIPGAEYHKFIRAVGTDYYNKNKTHSGLQYQSVVGSNDHILYVYEDYGFDNYKIVGRVDYADVETANKVMELIDNGETIEITELVSEVSEWLKARQSSYSIYNAYTKKRRSSRGVHSVSAKQSRSIARGTDGSSGRDAENGRADDISFSLEDDGEFDLFDLWEQKNKEFGTIKKGENPTRDIDVPKKITKEKLVSQFARTMLEAGVTPDTAVSEFEKRVLDGTMTHEVITNDSARQWAINQIKYHGFEEAMNTWSVYTRDGNVGKKELALGMELYNQCITSGDVTNAMRIAAELVAEATHAGQTLQATRMLKLMTPDGQLYYLEKSIQKMNDEFKKKIGEKYEDIELNEDLMEKFLTEKDADKRDEIYDDICQDIADQIPATLLDKWNSWRYLAMLGNPRTHIRNIAGNVVFTPAIKLKNYIGAIIERLARVDESKRTKSMHKSKEAVEFAKKDFSKMQKVLQGENAKYAVTSDIEGKRTIFKTKWLEALRNKNFEWLEKEDMWFLKRRYVDALAQIITARKLDVDSIDEKTLDIARAYAVREAQRATFRDANALAEALNKLQKKASHSDKKAVRAASVLIEGVMPFKKTPLNIAKQGVQYSPVGILTGVYKTVAKAKNGDMYSTTDIIDDFAKGLTGTAIMLLGTLLASLGIVSGGDDENKKKKEFDKMVGEQSFSLNIGDSSYTIDWMTPACLPLFTGVELYELTKDDFKFADIVNALSSLTDPLLELSVFSGISGAIESAQYNDTNTLFAIGSDMTTSYLTQALPTIGGQLSRIIDKNKREYYYTDKNSNLPKGVQNFIGQVSSKIPFASYLFEPSIDEWGREETYGSIVERTLENAVSPGYYSEKNYTEVDEEIKRLYESTGEADVLPVTQQKKYTESKVDYPMTAAQWTEAKRIRGQKSFELIEQLFSDKMQVKLQNKETGEYQEMFYSQMSDEEKIRAIINCYEDARDYTKEQMLDKVKSNRKK